LSFNLLPDFGLDVVGFSFSSQLLFELLLVFVVGFFFIILDSEFFVNRDKVMNSSVESLFKQA
jgi:hypothetical protein